MADFVKFKPEENNEEKSQKRYRRRRINFKGIFLLFLLFFLVSSIISSITYSITPKIAVIPIKGVISSEASSSVFGSTLSSRDIADQIRSLKDDSSVKAILIDINSPGGSPVASEEISRAIEDTKKEKPVYAIINDIGASGGYWIGVSADKLYASKLSVVGSIGVTSAGLSYENLIKDYNITYRQQTAGKYKDLGSPFREQTQEEKEIMQKLLDDLHSEFKIHISKSRNISLEELEEYAQGQIFLGEEAKEIGLIDDIGYYDSTIDELRNITSQNAIIINYEPEPSLIDILKINSIFEIPKAENQILFK